MMYLSLLIILMIAQMRFQKYDENLSAEILSFAGIAYCVVNNDISNWNCYHCIDHLGVTNVTKIQNQKLNINGYVAFDKPKNHLILSFAGTDPLSIQDWINDIGYLPEDYPFCEGCQVHAGFYHSYLSVRNQTRQLVKQLIDENPTAELIFTGHSFGAVLSLLAALDFKEYYNIDIDHFYNYGQPRLGNPQFQQYVKRSLKTYFRVTHNRDPVPHLPLQSMGFQHTSPEIFYYSADQFKICDQIEQSDCSDQYQIIDIADHLFYLHFDFVTNYLRCKF